MPTTRAFIAIPIPSKIQRALGGLQDNLKKDISNVRWTKPESIHLTLKFLGDVEDEKLAPIGEALKELSSKFDPLNFRADGLDCFPPKGSPRVIWVGLREDSGTLGRLVSDIERAMEKFSFPKENRGFTPHLTLGRVRDQKSRMTAQIMRAVFDKQAPADLGTFEAKTVELIKSELTPKGAIYSNLTTAPLGHRP